MKIVPPDPAVEIVNETGFMHNAFRLFTLQVASLGIVVGAGSPEGVVDATQTTLYMDETPSATPIVYIKQLTDIAGDTTKGWEGI